MRRGEVEASADLTDNFPLSLATTGQITPDLMLRMPDPGALDRSAASIG